MKTKKDIFNMLRETFHSQSGVFLNKELCHSISTMIWNTIPLSTVPLRDKVGIKESKFLFRVLNEIMEEVVPIGFSDDGFCFISPFSKLDSSYINTVIDAPGVEHRYKDDRITNFTRYVDNLGLGVKEGDFDLLYDMYADRMDELFLEYKTKPRVSEIEIDRITGYGEDR